MKWINRVLDEKSDGALAFFWQLVGPIFVLCTYALEPHHILIFFAGVIGLFVKTKFVSPIFGMITVPAGTFEFICA